MCVTAAAAICGKSSSPILRVGLCRVAFGACFRRLSVRVGKDAARSALPRMVDRLLADLNERDILRSNCVVTACLASLISTGYMLSFVVFITVSCFSADAES